MKLSVLHEATLGGLQSIGYQIIGATPQGGTDVFKPKGKDRWYYRNSPLTLRHKLKKNKGLFRKNGS